MGSEHEQQRQGDELRDYAGWSPSLGVWLTPASSWGDFCFWARTLADHRVPGWWPILRLPARWTEQRLNPRLRARAARRHHRA